MSSCPCGTGLPYEECCRDYITGASKPPTAELLMRSRYTAYAKVQLNYLFNTLHPKARKGHDRESTRQWAESSEWIGLEIVSTEGGGEDDATGTVEFIARYRPAGGEEVEHHEVAEFVKDDGDWYFRDGRTIGAPPLERQEPKVGRNDPCPCGSGKKYKKCCG